MHFDVVVVGAGIHGAGVAQAVAANGHSVLVLEQYNEAAKGSSSRSSKLIHGGLRYLETGQFQLVRECLEEREILLRNAPHLVKLVPFHIPVYRETRRRPWKVALGLGIYSIMSRKRFHRIAATDWAGLDGLRTDHLDAVFSYYDAQTDDARLTRAVLASARELGASLITSAAFVDARITADAVTVGYSKSDAAQTVTASVLINAAGPWVNQVLDGITDRSAQKAEKLDIDLVQGSHIVVPGTVAHPYYLEAPRDGRAVFVVPWKQAIMIGTTENHYQGDPARVEPLAAEINYLLEIYNFYFNNALTNRDVIDAFAGLRVLPGGSGEAFNKSRDTMFLEDDPERPRLLSIYGGKLTSYRAAAEKVLASIAKTLPVTSPVADTRNRLLPVID
jgi:glycerol-3-phosphate dehydrogenase